MRIHITTCYPQHDGQHMVDWLKKAANLDSHGKHKWWDDPETADAILFFEGHAGMDPLRLGVLFNPIYRKYRQKCFLYHDGDYAYPFMPGLYPSLLKEHHKPGWCEGAPYFARQAVNEAVTAAADLNPERKWLASFIGANNCPVRKAMLNWSHPLIHLKDTTGLHAWEMDAKSRQKYETEYAQICGESKAILAPRGLGPSTYRLYEAMEIGRCPIILSDSWVPPLGIDWIQCSIKLPESSANDTEPIVDRLGKEDIEEKGDAASEQFINRLSTPHAWDYVATQVEALTASAKHEVGWGSIVKTLKTKHRRIVLGSIRRSIKKNRKLFS